VWDLTIFLYILLELLFIEGKMVEDNTVLSDLGVQSGQTVQVEIQSADPINRPLHYRQASSVYKLPDKVNVKVEVGKYTDFCSAII